MNSGVRANENSRKNAWKQRNTQKAHSSEIQHPVTTNTQMSSSNDLKSSTSSFKLNIDAAPFYPSHDYAENVPQQPPMYPNGNFQQFPAYSAAPVQNYPVPYVVSNSSMEYMQPVQINGNPMDYQNMVNFAPMYGMIPPMVVPNHNSSAEVRFEAPQSAKLPSPSETSSTTESSETSSQSSTQTESSTVSSENSSETPSSSDSESRESRSNQREPTKLKLQNQHFFKPQRRQPNQGNRGNQGNGGNRGDYEEGRNRGRQNTGNSNGSNRRNRGNRGNRGNQEGNGETEHGRKPRRQNTEKTDGSNPGNQGNQGNQGTEKNPNSETPQNASEQRGSGDRRRGNARPQGGNVETNQRSEGIPADLYPKESRRGGRRRRNRRGSGVTQEESIANLFVTPGNIDEAMKQISYTISEALNDCFAG